MGRGADLLFEARHRARISQAELARRSGIARPVINAYERGKREPSVAAMQRLLDAAGCRLVVDEAVRRPDPDRAARDLEALLGLADAIPARPERRPLEFPTLARR
jgi:transcriptional regulator with XRE-family HTH domain